MAMDKRDICFAQCGTYLLSWLTRDADKDRYHSMKESLAFIHRTLDDEDEATSEPEPEPKRRHVFKRGIEERDHDDADRGVQRGEVHRAV